MDFYPRSPCGERLHYDNYNLHCVEISIHALLAESDNSSVNTADKEARFLSTLSLRRATEWCGPMGTRYEISIHALLAESDLIQAMPHLTARLFLSTLSLRRATHGCYSLRHSAQFLSTLSLRRATTRIARYQSNHTDFYPRSPCGERQPARTRNDKHNIFLSTLSLRRATGNSLSMLYNVVISIHALLAESDPRTLLTRFFPGIFLSTLSLRRATLTPSMVATLISFLSTLSLRRATASTHQERQAQHISIHALLAESDSSRHISKARSQHFYPRSPCGERPVNI